MSAVIVLDTGPLGLLTNPNHTAGPVACRQWLSALQAAGRRVIVPEIADYERWFNLDQALRKGLRGLPGGSSLAKLLARHRGVPNIAIPMKYRTARAAG